MRFNWVNGYMVNGIVSPVDEKSLDVRSTHIKTPA